MKQTIKIIMSLILAVAFSACGTRDYQKPPTDYGQPVPPRQNEPRAERTARPRVTTEGSGAGYLWKGLRWAEIPQSEIDEVKCHLADSIDTSRLQSFSSALVSGAVIGVIGKFSNAWLFGKPEDLPREGHWFWNNFDRTIRNTFGGAFRGALLVGGCQTLLSGGNITWFSGVLGEEYTALSTALSVGAFASIASKPYIWNRWAKMPQRPAVLPANEPPPAFNGYANYAGKAFRHLKEWSSTSDIGLGIRYRFVPGVMILGIGGGLGYLIYQGLTGDSPADPACTESSGHQTSSSARTPDKG
jgi:hypothetical protein